MLDQKRFAVVAQATSPRSLQTTASSKSRDFASSHAMICSSRLTVLTPTSGEQVLTR